MSATFQAEASRYGSKLPLLLGIMATLLVALPINFATSAITAELFYSAFKNPACSWRLLNPDIQLALKYLFAFVTVTSFIYKIRLDWVAIRQLTPSRRIYYDRRATRIWEASKITMNTLVFFSFNAVTSFTCWHVASRGDRLAISNRWMLDQWLLPLTENLSKAFLS